MRSKWRARCAPRAARQLARAWQAHGHSKGKHHGRSGDLYVLTRDCSVADVEADVEDDTASDSDSEEYDSDSDGEEDD